MLGLHGVSDDRFDDGWRDGIEDDFEDVSSLGEDLGFVLFR